MSTDRSSGDVKIEESNVDGDIIFITIDYYDDTFWEFPSPLFLKTALMTRSDLI